MAVASMDEELVKLTENLLDSLNLQLPAGSMDDYSFLKSDMFYVEIFKVIMEQSRHPFNEAEFDRETRGLTSGERIQTLINVLARDILNVDLEHIKGEKIAIGDTKHVSNMLQLLDALWQNYRQNPVSGEDDGEEEQKIESDLNRHDSFSQERELNRGVHEKKESNDFDTQARGDPDLFNKMMVDSDMHQQGASSAQGNIPMYTDDPINYNQIELQPKYYKAKGGKKQQTTSRPRPQSGIQTNSSLRQTRPKTAGLKSKKRGVVKIIEDNVYGARRDRNIKKRTLVKDPLAQVNRGVIREFNRLKKHGDDLEYDPMLLDGNIETLRQVLDANKKTTNVNDAVRRQKDQYRQELQDFIAFSKKNDALKGFKAEQAKEANMRDKAKAMQIYQEKIQEGLQTEEKAMQLRLRDEEANYVRAINKIVFNLKKKKAIEEKQNYKQDREQRVKETFGIISSIENFYKDRISLLKDRLGQEKVGRREADYAQRKMLSEYEREMKAQNRNQMGELINKWRGEREKFNSFLREDAEMEAQFLKLFQKYKLY